MGIGETNLRRLRQYITEGSYVVTVHAVDEMTDDDLTVFDVGTLHELERIKLHRRELAAKRPIPVASFGKTAA